MSRTLGKNGKQSGYSQEIALGKRDGMMKENRRRII